MLSIVNFREAAGRHAASTLFIFSNVEVPGFVVVVVVYFRDSHSLSRVRLI